MKRTSVVAIVFASFAAVMLCAVAPCAAAGDPAKEPTAKDALRLRRAIARVVRVEDPDGEVRLLRIDEEVVIITARRLMNQELYADDRIETVGKVRLTIRYYGERDKTDVVSSHNKQYRVRFDGPENPKGRWDNTVGWFSEFLRPFSSGGDGRNVERPSVLK